CLRVVADFPASSTMLMSSYCLARPATVHSKRFPKVSNKLSQDCADKTAVKRNKDSTLQMEVLTFMLQQGRQLLLMFVLIFSGFQTAQRFQIRSYTTENGFDNLLAVFQNTEQLFFL